MRSNAALTEALRYSLPKLLLSISLYVTLRNYFENLEVPDVEMAGFSC